MIIATSSPLKFKIGAEIIKWHQSTDFSHVLIIKDDLVYQASHGLVNCMHIDVFLLTNKIITVYEIDDNLVDFNFVKRQLGKEYSTEQILNIASKYLMGIKIFKTNVNSKFICSKYVGKALKLDWVDDSTTPKQIDEYLRKTHLTTTYR